VRQHQARGADRVITDSIDAHVEAERGGGDDDDGTVGVLVPVGSQTPMARGWLQSWLGWE
jgi:hypothetical protein